MVGALVYERLGSLRTPPFLFSTSISLLPPVPPAAVAAVSDAPSAPARRPNDPAREFIFGPVKWKSNVNAEARTIIAEGMTSSPNMRLFHASRPRRRAHCVRL
ncbi:hypothetical protein DFH09DRAFT_1339177 [Mycena vulgaris]|nr:hypothetical protein DFH09DRAFT_1339177 [Mycena vulgaris]